MAQRRGQQHQSNQGRNQSQGRGNTRHQQGGMRGGSAMEHRWQPTAGYGDNQGDWSGRTWYDEPRDYGGRYGQNRQRFGDYDNDWESERSYNEPEYSPGLGEPGWRAQGGGWNQRGYYGQGTYGQGSYGQGSYGQGWSGQNRTGQHAGKGPKGYQRSDERIREEISDELTDHPDIDASDIEIEVKDGEVTLTGTVDSRDAKRMTEDIAELSSGVTHVSNQLRVNNGSRMSGGSEGESSDSMSGRSTSSSSSSRNRQGRR